MAKIYNPSNGSLTVIHNFEGETSPFSVDRFHPNYKELKKAFDEDRLDDFCKLTKTSEGVKVFVEKDSAGNDTGLRVEGETVLYHGKPLHNSIVDRILGMKREGHKIDYMMNFLGELLKNPSSSAVEEAYDFLANRNLPITEDGCFLSYKSVFADFRSKRGGNNLTLVQGREVSGGHIDNSIGQVIECVRNEVDDERDRQCSKGLHVGGLEYSGPNGWYHGAGDKVIIVKVNPKDIVSVPKDHNAQKVRVCKYEVVEEFKCALPEYSTQACVDNRFEDYVNDFYDGYDDEEETFYYDTEDLEDGMNITFVYNAEDRYCTVESVSVDGETITGLLLMDDPSYRGFRPTYRTFRTAKMKDIEQY